MFIDTYTGYRKKAGARVNDMGQWIDGENFISSESMCRRFCVKRPSTHSWQSAWPIPQPWPRRLGLGWSTWSPAAWEAWHGPSYAVYRTNTIAKKVLHHCLIPSYCLFPRFRKNAFCQEKIKFLPRHVLNCCNNIESPFEVVFEHQGKRKNVPNQESNA